MNTYIQEEGRGKGSLKDYAEKVTKLMKRSVREHGSTEAKGEAASGSKEWPEGSNTPQSRSIMATASLGFDKWSPEP